MSTGDYVTGDYVTVKINIQLVQIGNKIHCSLFIVKYTTSTVLVFLIE